MALRKLNVSLDAVVEALDDRNRGLFEHAWYLDSQTGEVIGVGGDVDFDVSDPGDKPPDGLGDWEIQEWERCRAIADDPEGRYIEIPPNDAHEAWQLMEDFIETVPDRKLAQRLESAIRGRGAFRRFKDELFPRQDVLERWYAFETEAKRRWAIEWLEENGIESTWSPPVVEPESAGWQPGIVGVHHVQLTVPKGEEEAARQFYCGLLGLAEIEKPAELKGRGGLWLGLGDLEVHIGVEEEVDRTATKAHIAYQVTEIARWRDRLIRQGVKVLASVPIPGFERFEFRDPFGNRVEFIQPVG